MNGRLQEGPSSSSGEQDNGILMMSSVFFPKTCDYVSLQRGIKVTDGVNVANHLTLTSGDHHGLSD